MSACSQTVGATDQCHDQFDRNRRVLNGMSQVRQKDKGYFYLGVLLTLAFWIQYGFELQWKWLAEMQANETFKQGTGLTLVMYVGHQWYLGLLKAKGHMHAAKSHYQRHKRMGALAPLVFYVHSIQIGYAYLGLLSVVYFANVLLGLFNQETVRSKQKWFSSYWLVAHVSLSVLLVSLITFHISIAFIYE